MAITTPPDPQAQRGMTLKEFEKYMRGELILPPDANARDSLRRQIEAYQFGGLAADHDYVNARTQFHTKVPPREMAVTSTKPMSDKIGAALSRLSANLPFAVVRKIEVASYMTMSDSSSAWFRVKFEAGKALDFPNLDTFPDDADIARICLECP